MPRSFDGTPTQSARCEDGEHAACHHEAASGGHLGLHRGRPALRSDVWLCRCSCHHACDLYGRELVSEEIWASDCSCEATPAERQRRRAFKEDFARRRAEAQAESALVMAEVRVGPGATAESIRADLVAALAKHQLTWSDDRIEQAVAVRAAASSTGPKPLVALRVTRAALRPYADLWRMLKEHHVDDD